MKWYKKLIWKMSFLLPDKLYIKLVFRIRLGYWINLNNPKTYNEKLQWMKLYDRNPLYIKLVDKYEVRKIVAEKIGNEYIIPLVGGPWDDIEDIDFNSLPEQFVLKCTHDSGGVIICQDKSKMDISAIKIKLKSTLSNNYFKWGREWPYKHIKHRIIAEKYMVDTTEMDLKDYKFFCFDGEPRFLFIASERASVEEETKFDFYDMDFNLLPFTQGHPNSKNPIKNLPIIDEMKEIARKLSEGIPQVRVDLYEVGGHVYFGEMTLFHFNGFMPFKPSEWDKTFGEYFHLSMGK